MTNYDRERRDIDVTTHVAARAVDFWVSENQAGLDRLDQTAGIGLIVRAALTYLIGEGMVVVVGDSHFTDPPPCIYPGVHLSDLETALSVEVVRQEETDARVNAVLDRADEESPPAGRVFHCGPGC